MIMNNNLEKCSNEVTENYNFKIKSNSSKTGEHGWGQYTNNFFFFNITKTTQKANISI